MLQSSADRDKVICVSHVPAVPICLARGARKLWGANEAYLAAGTTCVLGFSYLLHHLSLRQGTHVLHVTIPTHFAQ